MNESMTTVKVATDEATMSTLTPGGCNKEEVAKLLQGVARRRAMEMRRFHIKMDRAEKEERDAANSCDFSTRYRGLELRCNRMYHTGEWQVGLGYFVCDADGYQISPLMGIADLVEFTSDLISATDIS